ncbi:MAG: leucine-rich repeat protein [Bacilli bacterium]|nr:leucine-rich repeat protein [Bacilli bacterium]
MRKINVYNKYNKKGKTLRIINIILIIYIFTLGIGYSLFKESLTISGTVSTTPAEMFTWESDTVISGLTKAGVEVLKSKGGELIIPEGVTAIADSDVMGYDKGFSPYAIGKVVTGSTLSPGTSVDEYDIITSVSFPSTMRRIGKSAFVNSKKLSRLSFKEGLQEIGTNAFTLNDNLSGELYIPDSVKTVGQASFSITTNVMDKLTSISISQTTSYDTSDNILGSFFGRGNITIRQPQQSPLFIWESDTVISGLTDEGIASVKANGGHLVIPDGVTEIAGPDFNIETGEGDFNKGFSPIVTGKLDLNDPDAESKLFDPEINFITKVTFPASLRKIGNLSFMYCLNLTGELNIPSRFAEIGEFAFAVPDESFNKVTSISISENASYVETSFLGRIAPTLRKEIFRWESETIISGLTKRGIEEVKANGGKLVIPEGVTEIAGPNCVSMDEECYIDKGFSPLSMAVTMGADVSDTNTVINNPDYNFITSVNFPSTLKKIGLAAFFSCYHLSEMPKLPDGLTEIGIGAFAGITTINFDMGPTGTLVIPDSVRVIGQQAFYLTNISGLQLGNGLESIGDTAFALCHNLQGDIIIPDSVKTIGKSAFAAISETANKINSISISKNTAFVNNDNDQNSFYSRPTPTIRD